MTSTERADGTRPLDGMVAIVTGASSGIGRAIVMAYVEAGARVALVSRRADVLAQTAHDADPTGENVLTVAVDVTAPDAGATILEAVLERFGRIDVLVNNAGMHYPTPLLRTSMEDWNAILELNLISAVNLTRAVGAELVRQKSGCVINVTSSWATRAMPQHSAYVTAKAALAHFTRTMAREWARHGVRVNALAPGYFSTEITREGMDDPEMLDKMLGVIPQRRIAEPGEITPLAVYLASPAASYVTGASYVIDGGMQLT